MHAAENVVGLPDVTQDTPPCSNLGVDQSELERGYTYQEGGLDWDNATWACNNGALQSPVNFPSPSGGAWSFPSMPSGKPQRAKA